MLLNFNAFVALFALISLGITHASVVGADNGTQIVRCGNPDPSLEYLQQTQELFSVMEKQGRLITLNATGQANPPPISVDVYAWLLVEDTEDKAYWPPLYMVSQQMTLLQTTYARYNIIFNHKSTKYVLNRDWANNADEYDMKQFLRSGDYSTLNLYYVQSVQADNDRSIGKCTMPAPGVSPGEDQFVMDGCVVLVQTIPGGDRAGVNLGMTTIHEAGHWFGLQHTFFTGCEKSDSYIMDTKPEAYPSVGCPSGRNTCPDPNDPRPDPVHNYMDWSDDHCMTEFSPGQMVRMHNMWNGWRHTW